MNLQLDGRRALVTGSTAGIGFAIAEVLAREGARVIGIFEPKPFEEIPDEDWRHFFEVNVLSGVRRRC